MFFLSIKRSTIFLGEASEQNKDNIAAKMYTMTCLQASISIQYSKAIYKEILKNEMSTSSPCNKLCIDLKNLSKICVLYI